MQSKKFISANEIEWQPAGEGVERQILGYCDELMVVRVKFVAGTAAASHKHPHAQCSYIESGKFEFTVDGEMQVVSAGDGILIKSNQVHQCTCLEAGVIIDTFAPMREDFVS